MSKSDIIFTKIKLLSAILIITSSIILIISKYNVKGFVFYISILILLITVIYGISVYKRQVDQ